MRPTLIIIIVFACFLVSPLAAQLSRNELAELTSEAAALFQRANETARTDWDEARRLYDESIMRYRSIIEQGNVANPYLYYNIGNAFLLKGDIGRAVLNFRRAELFESNDMELNANLKKNLQTALEKRRDQVPVKPREKVLQTLFFWHYDLNLKTKFIIVCLFWTLAWLAFSGRLLRRRGGGLTGLAVFALILSACFAGSIAVETIQADKNPGGVIVVDEVIARQGDGINYPPSFKDPLHSGTEFQIREKRPKTNPRWWRIELASGDQAWIPVEAGAQIIP